MIKMSIGTKIRSLRNSKEMSQNDLANAIGVSRQAITKWESDGGTPELDSLVRLSELFSVDLNSLVRDDACQYSSLIQYDIDCGKDFEMELIPSHTVIVEGGDSEKIRIEMQSETISTLDSDIKIAIEDRKRKMSLKMNRKNDLTESQCRDNLIVRIRLPRRFIETIDLRSDVKELRLKGFETEDVEFNGEAEMVTLEDVHGQAEMDVRSDCLFRISDLDGSLEINQIGKSSVVEIPAGLRFRALNGGRKCELKLSDGLVSDDKCEDFIELNGMKSKLEVRTWDTNTDHSSSSQ